MLTLNKWLVVQLSIFVRVVFLKKHFSQLRHTFSISHENERILRLFYSKKGKNSTPFNIITNIEVTLYQKEIILYKFKYFFSVSNYLNDI